ncbi:hypothetical protein JTB14_011390 [Gonioctena quinquepunctata]|nr:hypothetical protein JTB14_011390 [Gonioctena quinquepunctata]
MSTSEQMAIRTKLNRLNKNELIEIIVNRKLPYNLSECTLLGYINRKCCEEAEKVEHSADASDKIDSEYLCATEVKNENTASRKLIHQLEKRTSEQEMLIHLLKKTVDEYKLESTKLTSSKIVQRPTTSTKCSQKTNPTKNIKTDRAKNIPVPQADKNLSTYIQVSRLVTCQT